MVVGRGFDRIKVKWRYDRDISDATPSSRTGIDGGTKGEETPPLEDEQGEFE